MVGEADGSDEGIKVGSAEGLAEGIVLGISEGYYKKTHIVSTECIMGSIDCRLEHQKFLPWC